MTRLKTSILFSSCIACVLLLSTASQTWAQQDEQFLGRVIDSKGKPVANAKVIVMDHASQWNSTTGADGKFKITDLGNIGDSTCFLFVQAKGYRFHGEAMPNPDHSFGKSLERQLTRTDEPASQKLHGKAWRVDRQTRADLVHKLIDPHVEEILESEKTREKTELLSLLAKLEPEKTMERLETIELDGQNASMVKSEIVKSLISSDPDAALEVTATFSQPYHRCYARILVAGQEAMEPDARRELLVQIVGDAKSIKSPPARIGMLGLVCRELSRAGENESAETLLKETHLEAAKLPNAAWAGFVRGAFAEQFCRVDFKTAKKMIVDLQKADSRNRHLGNAAHFLSSTNPEQAQELLDLIKPDPDSPYVVHIRDQYVPRACYRIAPLDLERALKLADSCHEVNFVAYSYGVIADAISQQEPEHATKLLRKSFATLDGGIRDSKKVKIQASQIAGALLATAERVDASLVPEMLWNTIALRSARTEGEGARFANWSNQLNVSLAAWLCPYDRAASKLLFENWCNTKLQLYTRHEPLQAMALIDPQAVVDKVIGFEDQSKVSRARIIVCEALLSEGLKRDRIPNHMSSGLWPIDGEDHDW